ncbi:MAG: PEP-CTERM sorting domain-containing protein [Deltaproteobacteria bacterium]|jgi:hypothetical protein|nr:PEP-CTERM sorting domain-containing protein [Deltaproteobacteria bacterium]
MKKFLSLFTGLFLVLVVAGSASATPIDFNAYSFKTGQPGGGSSGSTYGIWANGAGIGVWKDTWLNFDIPVTIMADTIMHIGVRDFNPNHEILGMQFLDSYVSPSLESSQAFSFAGSQMNWGNLDYRTVGTDWNYFDIKVGEHFTGTFGGIVFFSDNDVDPTGGGQFRNLEFNAVPEPATMLLFGLGLLGLAGVSRKKK